MIRGSVKEENEIVRSCNVERINLLRSRAGLLKGKDRALLKMYLDNGNTFRQMSRLAGVNEATVARRIHRLVQRLLDGEYITCLRNRRQFTQQEMNVAKDYFIFGLSMRKIASRQGVTYYQVRQALKKIQALVRVRAGRGEDGTEG